MVITCACPGCDNRYKTLRLRSDSKFHPGKLTFHKFPTSDPERLKLWLLALGLDINTPLSVLETRRICSDHFSPFDFKDTKGSIVQLKSWAVPMNLSEQFVDDPSKIGLHMEEPFNENVNMDFVANKEAGGFLNHELSKGHSHVCRRSRPEKRNPLSQDRGSKRSVPGSPEDATDSDNEDKDINTEENAQCSEELVITKVEDLSNETEFDQNENYSGKMDMDEPEDSEALRAKGLKSRPAHSSAVTQTQAADKRFAGFDPSDVLPVKIKDEPMDEEWKKAPQSPLRSIKDDEDFDQQRLGSYHQVSGVNNASTGAQTESIQNFKRLGVLCTACNKVLLKGQTAFQRSGSAKIYCSLECLRSTKNKACHHCLNDTICNRPNVTHPGR